MPFLGPVGGDKSHDEVVSRKTVSFPEGLACPGVETEPATVHSVVDYRDSVSRVPLLDKSGYLSLRTRDHPSGGRTEDSVSPENSTPKGPIARVLGDHQGALGEDRGESSPRRQEFRKADLRSVAAKSAVDVCRDASVKTRGPSQFNYFNVRLPELALIRPGALLEHKQDVVTTGSESIPEIEHLSLGPSRPETGHVDDELHAAVRPWR